MEPVTLIFVTGEMGRGKTTYCQQQLQQAKADGKQVGGLLSPAHFENGHKVGINLVALATGETRRAATLRQHGETSLMTKRWAFDPAVMAWGDQMLARQRPCDLLIIDELGPLELERGEGWQSALPLLDRGQFERALVVVRPQLLQVALARWPHGKAITVR